LPSVVLPSDFGFQADAQVVRLDAVAYIESAIRRHTGSDAEFAAVAADLGPQDPFAEIADRRFRRRTHGKFLTGRYNSDQFPAFYAAEDEATATQEVLHATRLNEVLSIKSPVYFEVTNWAVRGGGHDVANLFPNHPELVSDDWSTCQSVGAQAVAQRAVVLRVSSARRMGGCNLVALVRDAVRALGGTGRRVRIETVVGKPEAAQPT
jgi:hypothetical protein